MMPSTTKTNASKKAPKIIVRRGAMKKNDKAMESSLSTSREGHDTTTEQMGVESQSQGAALPENPGAVAPSDSPSHEEAQPSSLPSIPGFDLSNTSRNQQYAVRTMLVFADCCVQTSAEGVFHVLGRNFPDTGALCWWLQRIGKESLVSRARGKDIVDAARVVAHALRRQLEAEIGLPIPRW